MNGPRQITVGSACNVRPGITRSPASTADFLCDLKALVERVTGILLGLLCSKWLAQQTTLAGSDARSDKHSFSYSLQQVPQHMMPNSLGHL